MQSLQCNLFIPETLKPRKFTLLLIPYIHDQSTAIHSISHAGLQGSHIAI